MIVISNCDDQARCTSPWGNEFIELTAADIAALICGKTLGKPDFDEYGLFISMAREAKNDQT